MLKNAGLAPLWVDLGKEIRQRSRGLPEGSDRENAIAELNEMVQKHNLQCPPPMQITPFR